MSAAPVRILDRYGRAFSGSDLLFEGSKNGPDRPTPPRVDKDTRQNLSQFGYRSLLAAGRYLYANCPALASAINLQAELAVGSAFIPQYYGRNKAWGAQAETLLNEWHKIMDVRAGNYDWQTNLKLWSKSAKRDGDVGILLTETASGYPQVQTIPGHRIGSWGAEPYTVDSGPWKGADLRNGVISNDVARAMAYRVYDSDGLTWRDISGMTVLDDKGAVVQSADMRLWFNPDWSDQGRGISKIATGINDWGDIKQVREFIKAALKKESSFAVVEYTESGTVDTAEDFSRTGPTASTNAAAVYNTKTDGGLVQIYKANSGAKVEFPGGERPSERSQEFWNKVMRDAFLSIGWPLEFYDTMAKGGAALRLVMELAQPTVDADIALLQKIAAWIDGWRLAKAIKNGELPPDEDWWMVAHQPPAEITADKGYSAQIDRENWKIGFDTLKGVVGRGGQWWEDVREQQQVETDDLCARATALVAKYPDLTFTMALNLMQQRTSTSPAAPTVTEQLNPPGGDQSQTQTQ